MRKGGNEAIFFPFPDSQPLIRHRVNKDIVIRSMALIKDFSIFEYAYEKIIDDELFIISLTDLLDLLDILTAQAVQDFIHSDKKDAIVSLLNYNIRRQSEIKRDYFSESEESDSSDAQELDSGYTSSTNSDSDY